MGTGFLLGVMTMLASGGGCTTLNILKLTDFVHLNVWITWYVNSINKAIKKSIGSTILEKRAFF